ncbi:MAG: ABC transporter ATP-binding protein [Nitrospirales bacterium]|nr:ABC transporter ATP-binding protein [Nitrospirales bacterium]
MSSDWVIQAKDLGKAYQIYKKPEDRLKQMLWRGRRQFFDEFWALQSLNLAVDRGETIGIIGRNGSGKSTLLQLVCGTLIPTCGELTVKGRVAGLLELGAGFNPEFTGKENVYLAASVLGLTGKQIDERYESIEDFAAIGDFIHHPVKIYSNGMFARLAFAVVAHVDPDILIIDEILAVGDAAFTQKCMRFLHRFRDNGTLLFVSHNIASVTHLCNRVLWLDNGVVREIGPTQEVCHNYLAAICHEKENADTFRIGGSRKPRREPTLPTRDSRQEIFKYSANRNTIEIFDFDPNAPWFGERGASIQEVTLTDKDHSSFTTLEGGEEVILTIDCICERAVRKPIVGFYVKDRLGQYLFGDNTYLTYRENEMTLLAGQSFQARFHFQMPYLPTGDFSVVAAVAEGTQEDHVQHHWIDDALFFRVHTSHVARGLIGVPMMTIELTGCSAHLGSST